EPKAQLAFELASTSTGSRLLVAFFPFFPSRLFKNPPIVQNGPLPPIRRRVFSSHDTADGSSGWPPPRPRHFPACLSPAAAACGHHTSRLTCGTQRVSEVLPVPIVVHQAMGGFKQLGAQRRIGGSDQ